MKNTLPRFFLLSIALLCLLSGCAAKAFKDGKQAFIEGEYDASVAYFQRAVQKRPDNHEYRMYMQKAQIQGALYHHHKGRQLRSDGDLKGALREFNLAVMLDPSLEAAAQEAIHARQALQRADTYNQAEALFKSGDLKNAHKLVSELLRETPDDQATKSLLKTLEENMANSDHSLKSQFKSAKPVALEFKKTDIREAFEILSRLAGKNFILDKTIPNETLDLELKDVNLYQSFELLLNLYNLEAKPLNDKTILVFPNSGEKNKQYDDYKIKTIYLSHISAKQVVNLLRTMLKIKNIFVHEERNALVFRDRPEVIQLAEQVIAATDRAEAEVLFELELIEVNHSDALLFGPSLNPNSVSLGMAQGGNVVASGLSAGDAITNLVGSLSSLESVYTLPTAVFDFQKTLVDSEILATPKIRVRNRGKAKVHIGKREPVITVTTTGETSTDNIQYVDVGVKLDIEPLIQLDNTVVTNLSLEVSSVTEKTTTANGSLALSISTTNAQTALTLKNGERTVIGGLIRDDKTKTRKIIPLLGDLPLIGRLFTNHNKDDKKREILLSITTHILQNVDLPGTEFTDLWSGSEDELKTQANFAAFLTPLDLAEIEDDTSDVTEDETVEPLNGTSPEAMGTPEELPPTEQEQSVIQEESVDSPPLPSFSASSVPGFLLTAPRTVAVGETFEVVIGITNAIDLYSAAMNLSYRDDQLEVMEIKEGDFLGKDAGKTRFASQKNTEKPGYHIVTERLNPPSGVSGTGSLAKLLCKANKAGPILLGIEGENFQDSQSRPQMVPAQKIVLKVE